MSEKYAVTVLRPARNSLERLHPEVRRQIYEKLHQLESNPRPQDVKSRRGRAGYRVDSGKYRILYEIDDREKGVVIRVIKHRKDVYRNL